MLIEVMVSALLVGLMVVATLNGFDVANRTTTDQRHHNQAATLAGESQEQLRSDPATTLQTLQTSPHPYTQTIGGTTYTIVQKAELQPASGSNAACSVTENKRQSGNAFRITSTVSWPLQQKSSRPSVVASSIITPPTGSALEVDADNAPTVTAGVSGITATVKYTPVGSGAQVTLQQTTGSEGCVVFGGIPSTAALVEIGEVAGYVTRAGATKYPTKEVTIAPNYTTHYPILYNRGGAIEAKFAYKGETKYIHSNNENTGNVEEKVTGDTFVTFNALMEAAPDYEVGSTQYAPPTTVYKPLPGTYEGAGTSPSNLFPFAESETPWSVYAGDCVANNPKEVTGGVVKPPEKIFVKPGSTTPALVPTSLVTLNLYKGTKTEVNAKAAGERWKLLETATSRPVTITNPKCGATAPNNESAPSIKHVQATTTNLTSPGNGGHLADPFQPFGTEFELCVVGAERIYKVKYENKAPSGGNVSIYLPQRPATEVVQEREAKEIEYKAKETEYKAKETASITKETEYKTKETEYKAKETAYKTKETAYKTKETEYKTKETAYKAKETAYKNKEAEYKAKKTEALKKEYEKLKGEYETLKKEYEKLKGEYETLKGEYATDKSEFETDKAESIADKNESIADKTESINDKNESIAAKAAYEKAKTEENEEKEGASVTVEKGTVCP